MMMDQFSGHVAALLVKECDEQPTPEAHRRDVARRGHELDDAIDQLNDVKEANDVLKEQMVQLATQGRLELFTQLSVQGGRLKAELNFSRMSRDLAVMYGVVDR